MVSQNFNRREEQRRRDSLSVTGVDELLRERPSNGPEPTDQEAYYDSAPYESADLEQWPWTEGGRGNARVPKL